MSCTPNKACFHTKTYCWLWPMDIEKVTCVGKCCHSFCWDKLFLTQHGKRWCENSWIVAVPGRRIVLWNFTHLSYRTSATNPGASWRIYSTTQQGEIGLFVGIERNQLWYLCPGNCWQSIAKAFLSVREFAGPCFDFSSFVYVYEFQPPAMSSILCLFIWN